MKITLQGNEKIVVWIANIVNPLIAGFLFYYMWRKSFPLKAKEANKISFLVFVFYLIGYIIYKLVSG